MIFKSDHITPEIHEYIQQNFAPEDEVLQRIQHEAKAAGLPAISVTSEEGKILHMLVRSLKGRKVLEIGALAGYSAIWMGRALPPDGKLISLEYSAKHADFARQSAEWAGLAHIIEVRQGAALDLLPAVAADAPFDLCFIDADKPNYPAYLEYALRYVRIGGWIVADNMFAAGRILEQPEADDPSGIRPRQEYNHRVATNPRLLSTILPTTDGMTLALVVS